MMNIWAPLCFVGFPGDALVKNLPANAGDARDVVHPLGQKDPLKEEMATHVSILAWRIPWTEEAGRLHSPQCCKESGVIEAT